MNKLINTLQMELFMLLNALYYPKTTTCLYRPVVLFFFFSYVIVQIYSISAGNKVYLICVSLSRDIFTIFKQNSLLILYFSHKRHILCS